jgi:hypothetical protein
MQIKNIEDIFENHPYGKGKCLEDEHFEIRKHMRKTSVCTYE